LPHHEPKPLGPLERTGPSQSKSNRLNYFAVAGAALVLWLGYGLLAGGDDKKSEANARPTAAVTTPKAKPAPTAKTTPEAAATPEAKPALSDTERAARKIAREYHASYGPKSGYETTAHKLVRSFDKDLDPWDGSLTVHTRIPGGSNYAKAEGGELARNVGASVLSIWLSARALQGRCDGRRRLAHRRARVPGAGMLKLVALVLVGLALSAAVAWNAAEAHYRGCLQAAKYVEPRGGLPTTDGWEPDASAVKEYKQPRVHVGALAQVGDPRSGPPCSCRATCAPGPRPQRLSHNANGRLVAAIGTKTVPLDQVGRLWGP
jgi:hypothetical protein